jgi:hypothetical protein
MHTVDRSGSAGGAEVPKPQLAVSIGPPCEDEAGLGEGEGMALSNGYLARSVCGVWVWGGEGMRERESERERARAREWVSM